MTILESKISNQIRAEISKRGGYSIKLHSSGFQGAGEPDVIACIKGQLIAIETKRPGEHLKPIQTHRLNQWLRAGAITIVATSREDFKKQYEEKT